MPALDRLTSLLNNVRLHVSPAPLQHANLAAFRQPGGNDDLLIFCPRQCGMKDRGPDALFSLHVDFGTDQNPLRGALPDQVQEAVSSNGDLASIVLLLASEQAGRRCGSHAVLSRLGEVLVIRILRLQLDRGMTTPGLLAGLANERISQAIVAMHETPGRHWQNIDLADVCGLSHSRFKELFAQLVGVTPASYLRRWRLTLARTDLENGERVSKVAHRYGYRASDAFSRAYLKEFGIRPKSVRLIPLQAG